MDWFMTLNPFGIEFIPLGGTFIKRLPTAKISPSKKFAFDFKFRNTAIRLISFIVQQYL